MQKWILIAVGVIVALAVTVTAIGALLPESHVATVEANYHVPPDSVFALVTNVASGSAWRTGLKSVDVLSQAGQPLKWRENLDMGALVMSMDEMAAPTRVVTRIDDPGQPFGGRWIYTITPSADGTTLRISEEGEVYNPLFRFVSRFVFGHHRTLEQYARDVGTHFREQTTPQRITAGDVP